MIGEVGIQEFSAIDYESITINAGSSATLNASKADRARMVFITCENADIRFRYDGGNPTSTEGHILKSGETLRLGNVSNIKRLKFFNHSLTNATLRVTYLA